MRFSHHSPNPTHRLKSKWKYPPNFLQKSKPRHDQQRHWQHSRSRKGWESQAAIHQHLHFNITTEGILIAILSSQTDFLRKVQNYSNSGSHTNTRTSEKTIFSIFTQPMLRCYDCELVSVQVKAAHWTCTAHITNAKIIRWSSLPTSPSF